jgi:hypothetical protein
MTADTVAADAMVMADLQAKAATDPNANAKLARHLVSHGKYAEGEAAIRAAAKGKSADVEGAKVTLGHALIGQGKRPEATNAYNSVNRNNKWYSVARLWSLFARRPSAGA